MSVRRKTTNRLTLFRTCGTCGRSIVTTADTPWVRLVPRKQENGKWTGKTTYFCSERCFASSYRHIGWVDGKTEERRREKDQSRDPVDRREYNRRYYQEHAEQEKARARARYWADLESAREDNRYQRQKRKMREVDRLCLNP